MLGSYGCRPIEYSGAPHIWFTLGAQHAPGSNCWYGLVSEESKLAMLRPVRPMYSMFAVPPPYPELSMRPDVVSPFTCRMAGMGSALSCTPGTRVGSENDSDSTYTTVLSVSERSRVLLMSAALLR